MLITKDIIKLLLTIFYFQDGYPWSKSEPCLRQSINLITSNNLRSQETSPLRTPWQRC